MLGRFATIFVSAPRVTDPADWRLAAAFERRPVGRVLSRRLVGSVTNQVHPRVTNRRRMSPMKQNNFIRAGTACHEGKNMGDKVLTSRISRVKIPYRPLQDTSGRNVWSDGIKNMFIGLPNQSGCHASLCNDLRIIRGWDSGYSGGLTEPRVSRR